MDNRPYCCCQQFLSYVQCMEYQRAFCTAHILASAAVQRRQFTNMQSYEAGVFLLILSFPDVVCDLLSDTEIA